MRISATDPHGSQAVAMLSHSNIVTVYDVSRSAGQEYCYGAHKGDDSKSSI